MDGFDKQNEYLERLIDFIKPTMRIAQNKVIGGEIKPGYQKYAHKTTAKPVRQRVDHYTIGFNELVIDLDAPTYKANAILAQTITSYLKEVEIPYHAFWSGGKGIHIHIYFELPELDPTKMPAGYEKILDEAYKKKWNFWRDIRISEARDICIEAGVNPNLIGTGKPIDFAKMSFNDLLGKRTLIRACGGENAKFYTDSLGNQQKDVGWKTYLEEIPQKKPKVPVTGFEGVEYPPPIIPYQIELTKIILLAKRYLDSGIKVKEEATYEGEHMNLPCIQALMEGLSHGSRSDGAQAVAIATRMDGKTMIEAEGVLQEYVEHCEQIPEPYTLSEAMGWVKWIYEHPSPRWQCGNCKSLGVCKESQCPFIVQQMDSKMSILKGKDILDEVLRVVALPPYKHVNDKKAVIQLFFLMMSRWLNPPYYVVINSTAGTGKTNVMFAVANLFGEEKEENAYHYYTELTPSVLNRGQEIIDTWANCMVLIGEQQGLRKCPANVRQLISDHRLVLFSTEETKDENGLKKHGGEEFTTVTKNTLFVTCQAESEDDPDFGQLLSRSWIINTDDSPEQNLAVNKCTVEDAAKVDNEEGEEDLQAFRDLIRSMRIPDRVVIPPEVGQKIMDLINHGEERSRRDTKKFRDLVRTSAIIYGTERVWFTSKKGKTILVADNRDFEIVEYWAYDALFASMQGVSEATLSKYEALRAVVQAQAKAASVPIGEINFSVDDAVSWLSTKKNQVSKLLGDLCRIGLIENLTTPPARGVYKISGIPPPKKANLGSDDPKNGKNTHLCPELAKSIVKLAEEEGTNSSVPSDYVYGEIGSDRNTKESTITDSIQESGSNNGGVQNGPEKGKGAQTS